MRFKDFLLICENDMSFLPGMIEEIRFALEEGEEPDPSLVDHVFRITGVSADEFLGNPRGFMDNIMRSRAVQPFRSLIRDPYGFRPAPDYYGKRPDDGIFD